jgi:O-acetylserine/cysteine efflux transporter
MVWAALIAPIPMLGLSLLLEGPQRDFNALEHLYPAGLLAVAYVAILATLFGYGT